MTLFLTLDDNNGVLFNHRRQSRDSVLTDRMLGIASTGTLFITPFSEKLIPGERAGQVRTVPTLSDALSLLGDGDFLFAEDTAAPLASEDFKPFDRVIVFRWNRVYPADVRVKLSEESFAVSVIDEFAGSSHEKITVEEYVRPAN